MLTKYEIRLSYYLLQFGFIYPYLAPKYHFRLYMHIPTYLPTLTAIYLYLALFSLNYSFLVIFALNCTDLTQLFMEISHFKELGDTENFVTNAIWVFI